MFQFSYRLQTFDDLPVCIEAFKQKYKEVPPNILIQVYTPIDDPLEISKLTKNLSEAFPRAEIVGSTSPLNFKNEDQWMDDTLLTFLCFDRSSVKVVHYDMNLESSFSAGSKCLAVANSLPQLSGIQLLATLRTFDVTPFLAQMSKVDPMISIFGGGADAYKHCKGYVFDKNGVYTSAILAVFYIGHLFIQTNHILGWHPLGPRMTITKMEGPNVIKEIDGKPALHVYEKYLNINSLQDFEKLTFPLMVKNDNHFYPRLPLEAREDGALVLNISCYEGDALRFAYGDPNEMMNRYYRAMEFMKDFAPESYIFFTCVNRVYLMKENTQIIHNSFSTITRYAGCCSRGQFIREGSEVRAVNLANVAVSFREKPLNRPLTFPLSSNVTKPDFNSHIKYSDDFKAYTRLASLVTSTLKELDESYRKLEFVANHDGLTKLLNRSKIEKILNDKITQLNMGGEPFSAIMLDLDHFKDINDNYGHDVGDKALQRISEIITRSIRFTDKAGRWGGEEFVIILSKVDIPSALHIAERIRQELEWQMILPDGKPITASFGVTTAYPGEDTEKFFKRMDNALYTAKDRGRNQVYIVEKNQDEEMPHLMPLNRRKTDKQ